MTPSQLASWGIGPDALRDVLMHAGDILDAGVLHVDRELVVRGWNGWLEAASGYSADAVIGRPLAQIFPELEGSGAVAALRRALSGETVVMAQRFHSYLLPFPITDNFFEYMQQSVRIVPHLHEGEAVGAIAFIQDVTERVRREDELRDAIARAEGANQAKSEFLAAMSHELRTPLNVIVGYADLLESEVGGPLTARHREQVSRIKSSSWHLIGIIEEILLFSKVEAGKVEVALESIDVTHLTRDAIKLLTPQAANKNLDLRVCTPPHPVMITTDPLKLRQILLNLVNNALKFTEKGHVNVEIEQTEDEVNVVVADTGAGIPEVAHERIFEPFTQLSDSVKRAHTGTGLGLPISRKLARLLGGDLTVTSTNGQGSRFTVTLPVAGPRTESVFPPA